MLLADGKFRLDEEHNPPRLRGIERDKEGTRVVRIGRGIRLRLGDHDAPLDQLLDLRVDVDPALYRGLGNVVDACSVACASSTCQNWSLVSRKPRIVAKVVGILVDEPRFVLLTMPRLRGTGRVRKETAANRLDAGLNWHVLIDPAPIECPFCNGPNIGQILLEP